MFTCFLFIKVKIMVVVGCFRRESSDGLVVVREERVGTVVRIGVKGSG